MKKIQDLTVSQIYLFQVGAIPLGAVVAGRGIETVRQKFAFQNPSSLPWAPELTPAPALRFANGELLVEKTRVVVPSVAIEPRRILLTVSGTSEQADQVFRVLVQTLSELAPDHAEALSNVVYKAEETACIACLDLDFGQVFGRKVRDFLTRRVADTASKPGIRACVEPSRFAATITFELTDEKIKEQGITLNPKEFTVEAMKGLPIKDKLFVTKSPFGSSVHLELIKQLEGLFQSV